MPSHLRTVAREAYYEYRLSSLEHRENVFGWQLLSSKITFAVVVLLVLCGIIFSGIQFRVAMKAAILEAERAHDDTAEAAASKKEAAKKEPSKEDGKTPARRGLPSFRGLSTDLQAGGLRVQSSVLGVIILALSLLFFYLYLVYVYPIHEVS